ncbi:MAG: A/G-specific adenine glycosylase [Buchnera aphidicola (Brevicoryne brassicae)]|uniref:Adenine DNA glycosylase n=1 Tax=Buchnera aphidicola (Brevicoryne brassicae) TaxID=911343 RepID=A0AAJ5TXA3_9GAMM|nr:A/G-specific adenine glycosylase [Buchnera aphidicola]QCI20093.1 adenine DNA glycosylase [Buchnera aphidicola (Brevicoryne brassicae)]WAI18917.1 MAG: A/G-specific adenine glycosylase [Buchnera aphidicola (Brevicoryne brassicae)]
MTIYSFSQLVLNWYHFYGRKDLPWQKNKTLYIVWISEIMLQQTTVKSVIPYFEKFILNFPNIKTLSNAKLDEVLHLWSGLGYYNRARNIHKSAQIIQIKHNGIFPNQFIEVIKLPGIGKSTAGAILSLSLNFFYSILDGNVKRILIRYYGIIGSLKDRTTEKKLWDIIEYITPIHNSAKFNQAMMDLGSLICIRGKAKCNICPLNQKCVAYIEQKWEKYPLKHIKKKTPKIISWFVLIKFKNNFWIEKNTKKNIWRDLFCFPSFDSQKKALIWSKEKKINLNKRKKMISFFHQFSHFILHIHPILFELSSILEIHEKDKMGLWYDLNNPQHIGLPRPVKKILESFKKDIFLRG